MASTDSPGPAPPPSTSTASVNASASTNTDLDVTKLHALPSEQQELYLLTFTTDLARLTSRLDHDGASAHQVYIKKEAVVTALVKALMKGKP